MRPDPVVAEHVRWMQLRGLSPETVKLRCCALRLLARHAAGADLLQLAAGDLDGWQRSLVVAAESRRAYVVQVCGFYRWAAGEQLLDRDPSVVLVRPKIRRGVPRPIAEADLQAAVAGAGQPVRCWLELAAYQGLRACELARLERGDVLDGERLLIVRGKGDKERMLPLGDVGLAALRGHGLPRAGLVFRRADGRGCTPVYVSNRANAWLRRAGVDATLHQCRHRFASAALDAVGDLRVVQELLGHASPATTAIYTRVCLPRAAEAVSAVDRLRLRAVS